MTYEEIRPTVRSHSESLKWWLLEYQIQRCIHCHVITKYLSIVVCKPCPMRRIKRLIYFNIGTLYSGIENSKNSKNYLGF
jgi:hypothetical protein